LLINWQGNEIRENFSTHRFSNDGQRKLITTG